MTERIDHAAEARRNIDGLHDYQSEEGMTDASMLTVAIEAQVHATLALVQEQRIANLIAMFQLKNEDVVDAAAEGFSYLQALAEICDGLGRS